MMKKSLVLLAGTLLLAGCQATLTNLTPTTQARSTNNLYTVELALASRQQTMRWDSIQPQIVSGGEFYPMRPTIGMTNRWEGLLPVGLGTNLVRYRYKVDYKYNTFGKPQPDSAVSQIYTLKIVDQP